MIIESDIINKFIGIKYKLYGRDQSGLDCYGLVLKIYEMLGIDLKDYNVDSIKKDDILNFYKDFEKINNPKLFDIVFFKLRESTQGHIGIVLNNDKVIHCSDVGVTVNRLSVLNKILKFDGFYRHNGSNKND